MTKRNSGGRNIFVDSAQDGWVGKFAAFFVPFLFMSNLYKAVPQFTDVIDSYHSYILSLVIFFVLFWLNGKTKFSITPDVFRYALTYSFFMFVCLFGILLNSEEQSLVRFMDYAWMALLGVGFAYTYRYNNTMRYLYWGIFCALFVVGIANVYEFLNPNFRVYADAENQDVIVGEVKRLSGIYTNANASAAAIVYCLFLLSFTLDRKILIPLFILAFFPILVTFSRSGIVSWGLLFVLVSATNKSGKFNIVGVVVSVALMTPIAYSIYNGQLAYLISSDVALSANEDMLNRITGNVFSQGDGSAQSRKDIAKEALNAFISNPLLGVGMSGLGSTLRTHNMFLQLGVELGILGLLSFLFFLVVPMLYKVPMATTYVILTVFLSMFSHQLLASPWFVISTAILLAIFPSYRRSLLVQDAFRRKKSGKRYRRKRRSA